MSTSGQFQRSGRDVGNVSAKALAGMGDMLKVPIHHPFSLVAINQEGVVPELVDVLIGRGFTRRELDWIVPARTLAYRRRKGERLKPGETDRFLRAVKILATAEAVFGSHEKALLWLRKLRRTFGGTSAMELMRTEAGGQLVEEVLGQVDEGFFA